MAEDSGQDRTEDPTSKKREESKKKGQVARSKEFSSGVVLFMTVSFAYFAGGLFSEPLVDLAKQNFGFDPAVIFDISEMGRAFKGSVFEVASVFVWLLFSVSFAAIFAAVVIGGWNFTLQSMTPKLSNMDPLKGLKERVFSVNGLVELFKALLKFIFIGGVGVVWVYTHLDQYIALADLDVMEAIGRAITYLIEGFFILVSITFLIAAVDVPYQMYQNSQKLKMTKQEVRDEYKNSEGKPEVKGRIKQLQREIAQRKMIGDVPDADVVITNPTHFTVALRYKPNEGGAPTLLAKGGDHLAIKIREIAKHHEITQIESPMLCRAIFYTTEINSEIPRGLYKAVAQVLAFVFQMSEYRRGQQEKPHLSQRFDIPDEYHFDARGRQAPKD